MHYKIVIVNENHPDKPGVYKGEVTPAPGDHPLLAALAAEFGDIADAPAVDRLRAWSGGESAEWAAEVEPDDDDLVWALADNMLYVKISDRPFPD